MKKIALAVIFALISVCNLRLAYSQQNEKDINDLIDLYNKGNKKISLSIALAYRDGTNGVKKDSLMAISWLEKAFSNGIYRAATIAGTIYYQGNGVKQDIIKAEKYYRSAAEKGHEDAMIRLGKIYYDGIYVRQSYVTAKKWYWEAAKKYENTKKCSIACKYYADINFFSSVSDTQHRPDYGEAYKWYSKAFDSGVLEAADGLAVMMSRSWPNVTDKPSKAKSRRVLLGAAERGYIYGMQSLAEDYEQGTYGMVNLQLAYAWTLILGEREETIGQQLMLERLESVLSVKDKNAGKKKYAALKKTLNGVYYQTRDLD